MISKGIKFSSQTDTEVIPHLISQFLSESDSLMSAIQKAIARLEGAFAIATDMRVFLTLNPFSIYLTQPRIQPGCVLRRTNWSVIEQQKLVSSEQVRDYKRRMNTFGFVDVLEGKPKIDCVYQNDAAGNLFLNKNGGLTVPLPESDNF